MGSSRLRSRAFFFCWWLCTAGIEQATGLRGFWGLFPFSAVAEENTAEPPVSDPESEEEKTAEPPVSDPESEEEMTADLPVSDPEPEPPEDPTGELAAAEVEAAPPEDPEGEPAGDETPIAEESVAAEAPPQPLHPGGPPPVDPEPTPATSSSSLDEPVKSPIMQRSLEREES